MRAQILSLGDVIDGPLLALLLFATALAVATLLVRLDPSVRGAIAAVGAARQTTIDGLRGVLGIGVFVHHTVITWFFLHGEGWKPPPSRFVTQLGDTSVALFFMITAFLFWGRVLARGRTIDWAEFFVARLYRLYPAYLLMLGLLAAAVFDVTRYRPPAAGAAVLRPLREWLLFTMFSEPDVNGLPGTALLVAKVTWSLTYEWLFYIGLPLLAFLFARGRNWYAALASACGLVVLAHGFAWHNPFKPEILVSFLGGIASAYWVRDAALARLARSRPAGLAALGALAAVVVCLPTAFTWPATLGLTAFFAVVASGNDFWGVLRRPGLLWLGDITYSIYLLHGLLLWLVFWRLLPLAAGLDGRVFVVVAVLVAAMLVVLSSIAFLAVERPAILMGRRHYRAVLRFRDVLRERRAARRASRAANRA